MITSRIAPTPNGEVHWGNLMNFAISWAYVKKSGGELWLRFDDIDRARCEEKYAEQVREILQFMGIDYQSELSNQIQYLEKYREYLKQIPRYVCDCSRKDIQERCGDFHYDGFCRKRNLQYKPQENAIRFLNPSDASGDFILWRREDIPAYHLTSVCDDEGMLINLVVRGIDLLESTQVQLQLSKSLKHDPLSKVRFIHHRLLENLDGEKLSKSRADGEIHKLITNGATAESLWLELSKRMGCAPVKSAKEFLAIDLNQYSA